MNATAGAMPVSEPKKRGGKRPGSGRPQKGRDDVVVRMARDLVLHAQYVCGRRGLSLAEYLDGFRPQIMKDFKEESAKAAGNN